MFNRIRRIGVGAGTSICGKLGQILMEVMEDMTTLFSSQIALTSKEQVIVVDKKEGLLLKDSKVFLVGKVLTRKPIN